MKEQEDGAQLIERLGLCQEDAKKVADAFESVSLFIPNHLEERVTVIRQFLELMQSVLPTREEMESRIKMIETALAENRAQYPLLREKPPENPV